MGGITKFRVVVASTLLALPFAMPHVASADSCRSKEKETRFFVPEPNQGARAQIADLHASHHRADAALIRKMIETPQAVWLTDGTPKSVRHQVAKIVHEAREQEAVPVLVAYNLPYRDCSQYSAGGAADSAAYKAWIDGFAAGIGHENAIVLVEPDGLGIIPWYSQFRGLLQQPGPYESCQPPDADPATAADDRFALMNYAVDALKALPHTTVYLDGTHTGWLGAGDAAHRLAQAGVARADGFFLNVSNYQPTDHLQKYGTWISKCIWFGLDSADWSRGHFDWCASQYYPATASDFSTWGLSDAWYAEQVEAQTYAGYPGDSGLAHFVIDTSRNGQGPWLSPVSYPDNQDWCNPPTRGLGFTPSTDTGVALNAAFLWVKVPGESDGQCNRGTGWHHRPGPRQHDRSRGWDLVPGDGARVGPQRQPALEVAPQQQRVRRRRHRPSALGDRSRFQGGDERVAVRLRTYAIATAALAGAAGALATRPLDGQHPPGRDRFRGGRCQRLGGRVCRRVGERILASLTVSPLVDDEGQLVGASKVVRDVTRQRRADERERQLFSQAAAAGRRFR